MTEKTWTIRDIDGSNPRQVTLAEFQEMNRQKADQAKAIFDKSVAAESARLARQRVGGTFGTM